MKKMMRRSVAAAAISGLALVGGLGVPAHARPVVIRDGLVNVTVGNITVEDAVDLNVAVSAAVAACDLVDVSVNQVAVLARAIAVDRSGRDQTICRSEAGDVVLENN